MDQNELYFDTVKVLILGREKRLTATSASFLRKCLSSQQLRVVNSAALSLVAD